MFSFVKLLQEPVTSVILSQCPGVLKSCSAENKVVAAVKPALAVSYQMSSGFSGLS